MQLSVISEATTPRKSNAARGDLRSLAVGRQQ
jgi:hypothetical protein